MKIALRSMVTVAILIWAGSAQSQVGNPELIAQAKKEGKVSWYSTVSIPESQQFAALFQQQFPTIKVDIIRSGSGAVVNRIISEHNAGKVSGRRASGFFQPRRLHGAQTKRHSWTI
jgi:ABC-type phosphate transport system substrate-binding protein